MKKVMIAFAAVALATCAQAASMKWKCEVYSGAANADYLGYTVYLCESLAADGFESEAAIQDYLYGSANNSGETTKNGSRSPYSYNASNTATGIADAEVGLKNVYAVIVSKDGKGYWTATAEGEVFTTAPSPKVATFDAKSLITTNYTPWNSGDVPEPTSGLLLLIGMAGLALRRKHA